MLNSSENSSGISSYKKLKDGIIENKKSKSLSSLDK